MRSVLEKRADSLVSEWVLPLMKAISRHSDIQTAIVQLNVCNSNFRHQTAVLIPKVISTLRTNDSRRNSVSRFKSLLNSRRNAAPGRIRRCHGVRSARAVSHGLLRTRMQERSTTRKNRTTDSFLTDSIGGVDAPVNGIEETHGV